MNRQAYIMAGAFVGGIAIATLVVVLVILLRGDGDEDAGDQVAVATSTAGPTAASPAVGAPPAGGTPAPEETGGPDEALEAFIADEYASDHIGECPQELAEGEPAPDGICSIELHRGEELVTFLLGPPFSEIFGEAVLTRREDGSWTVNFVGSGPLGETVSVGSEAVVFGAGSCLNFRDAPDVLAEVQICSIDGTTGQVAEGPQDADGHTWWRLEGLGWASGEFLRPVVE